MAIFKAFSDMTIKIFNSIGTAIDAGNNLVSATEKITRVGDLTAEQYLEEQQHELSLARLQMEEKIKQAQSATQRKSKATKSDKVEL